MYCIIACNICIVRNKLTYYFYRCDHNARWLKLANIEGMATVNLQCVYPSELSGVDWSEVNINQLIDRTSNYPDIQILFHAYSNILQAWKMCITW